MIRILETKNQSVVVLKEGSKEGIKEGTKEQTHANQDNDDDQWNQDFGCYCWIPALYYTILLMFIMNDSWKCGGRRWRWWRWRNLHISHFCCFLLSPSTPDQDGEYARALDALVKAVSGCLGAHEASWLWDHLLLGSGNPFKIMSWNTGVIYIVLFVPTALKPGQRFYVFLLSKSECYAWDCFGTYSNTCPNLNVTRVLSATQWTASVHTLTHVRTLM